MPESLDVDELWSPLPDDGYLDFMVPERNIPLRAVEGTLSLGRPGIFREEQTGWSRADGTGALDYPYDNARVAGDMADFDWVREHRGDETGVSGGGSNAPGPGALGWRIGAIRPSPHRTGDAAHGHGAAEEPPGPLPVLDGEAFDGERIGAVDVFSAIVGGIDEDAGGRREQALDYAVWFADLAAGTSTHGVPVKVFKRGWTDATGSDDYVARWVPAAAGDWNAVVIDPPYGGGHDEACEIDALRASSGAGLIVERARGVIVARRGKP